MPRRWIRDAEWVRQPHNKDGPPESLWWYHYPDRHFVINTYIARYKKGRAVPADFKNEIVKALDDLSRLQNKKEWGQPRTSRYWSIPAYALASGMKKATLMKWLREMEAVAKRLWHDRCPASRKSRPPLTEEDITQIRRRYLDGEDCKTLAQEYRIPPSKVGHLCREEKALRDENRIRLMNEHQPQASNAATVSLEEFEDDRPL